MKKSQERNIVECILYTSSGEIILQKKTEDYPILPGGYWCFFGGVIELDEKPLQTIKREIKEELGIELDNFKLILEEDYTLNDINLKGRRYVFKSLFSGKISDFCLSEGAGFGFFTKNEITDLKIAPLDKDMIHYFFNNKN